jgi:hypothetical protein
MATRNERRRRARQHSRSTEQAVAKASHGERYVARLVKAAESRQPATTSKNEWDPEKTVPPPIPPEALWTIFEQNAIHSGAINAKVADSVGRGWKLVPEDDTEDGATTTSTGSRAAARHAQEDHAEAHVRAAVPAGRPGDGRDRVGRLGGAARHTRRHRRRSPASCRCRRCHLRASRTPTTSSASASGEKKVYFKRFGVEPQIDFKTGEKARRRRPTTPRTRSSVLALLARARATTASRRGCRRSPPSPSSPRSASSTSRSSSRAARPTGTST